MTRFYADHGRNPTIKRNIDALVATMPATGMGLNVGSSDRPRIDPRVLNLDIVPGPEVDCVADASDSLPFGDNSIDLVITQEVLEHVRDPYAAMREISRVLRPGGALYLQVPFVIGYHPGPSDFWRFSREGIVELAESSGLIAREAGRSVGPATGFYRIAVEFFAILFGNRSHRLYVLAKGGFGLLLYPIKSLDRLMNRAPEADRIAGGYYVIAEKGAA